MFIRFYINLKSPSCFTARCLKWVTQFVFRRRQLCVLADFQERREVSLDVSVGAQRNGRMALNYWPAWQLTTLRLRFLSPSSLFYCPVTAYQPHPFRVHQSCWRKYKSDYCTNSSIPLKEWTFKGDICFPFTVNRSPDKIGFRFFLFVCPVPNSVSAWLPLIICLSLTD